MLEPRRPHIPDGAPIRIVAALVHGSIAQRTEGIGLKVVAVPLIEERVQHYPEVVVLKDGVAVATELVGGNPLRLTVEAPRRHVDVLVIEEHPHLRGFGRGRSLLWNLLDKAVARRNGSVDLFVEAAIEAETAR